MTSTTRQSNERPPYRLMQDAKPRGAAVALHRHGEAQLIFSAAGTVQVSTSFGRWLVPPQLAAWVPAGVEHSVDVLSDAEHRLIYWRPEVVRAWAPSTMLDRPFVLKVSPLLRQLIFSSFAEGVNVVKRDLVVRLILHELLETPDAPTFLPLPVSEIGRRVADLALGDGGSRLDIAELASRAATSARSISRLFPAETGMTYKGWRQRARIVSSIDRLAAGIAVSQAAEQAGFSSTAAFCFAFRNVTGMTPNAFVEL